MESVLMNQLSPLLKYPGGKEKELKYILPNIPNKIKNYYEPFVGGGAVYFSINAERYYINDKSDELISLYNMVKNQNEIFITKLKAIEHNWKILSKVVDNHKETLLNLYNNYKEDVYGEIGLQDGITEFLLDNNDEFNGLMHTNFNYCIENFLFELNKGIKNKMVRMRKIELDKGDMSEDDVLANIECALKGAFYTHFRYLINHKNELKLDEGFATAIYFFIRQTCYSSMFRYNKKGLFNVPYGGISYNRNSFENKINYFQSDELVSKLSNTTIGNMDFHDFMEKYAPKKGDFVFLDPPYDTEFSTYAKNEFNLNDQKRLAEYLINECECNFMIVIKNTEYISSLYQQGTPTKNGGRLNVNTFKKKYFVSFQDRNNKNAEHLMITNYDIEWNRFVSNN